MGRRLPLPPEELRALARAVRVQRELGAVRAHVEYQDRPLDWIVDKLGVDRRTLVWSANPRYEGHEWDGDPDPLVEILEAVARWKSVGVESGVGTGKTFLAACITLWFLACFEDSLVVTSAPRSDQLLDKMWREIERLWPRFQLMFPRAALMSSGEIRMRGDEGASRSWKAVAEVVGVGAAEAVATRAQGWHAEHMLIVVEEAAGAHPAVMAAYQNTLTGPHNVMLAIGNPDYEEDPLHEFCLQEDVKHVRISALDHPNLVANDHAIVPGACSRASVERLRVRYESAPALYKSRVRGISPEIAYGVALDNFDRARHTVELGPAAVQRAVVEAAWPVYVGVDPGDIGWAAVFGVVDPEGRMHVVRELFSQQEVLGPRMDALLEVLDALGCDRPRAAWYDSAAAAQGREMNRILRERGFRWSFAPSDKHVVPGAEGIALAYRAGFVTRTKQLLHDGRLVVVRGLGEGMTWRRGLSAASAGRSETGSRLLWEIERWRYPEPREGKVQKQDPDDATADGAHAIAALRYLVMGWWGQAARVPAPERERPSRDEDLGWGSFMEEQQREQRAKAREAKRLWKQVAREMEVLHRGRTKDGGRVDPSTLPGRRGRRRGR